MRISGQCILGCGLALAMLIPLGGANAQRMETVLYSFTGGSDGGDPYAALITDNSGNLYGTTFGGGTAGWGTVFKVTSNGTETVILSFNGGSGGANPEAGVISDNSGNLYGTTYGGGTNGCGTVFKATPGGKETVLYSFTCGTNGDGAYPKAGLIMDRKGNLYGTTSEGGAYGPGTVFKVSPNHSETVLVSFVGSGGDYPYAGLIMDAKGKLYGTTYNGGGADGGTVFKLTRAGTETVLLAFNGGAGGADPYASLIMDTKGSLYGTTSAGGNGTYPEGTVFKIARNGSEKVLYNFCSLYTQGGCVDGSTPHAGLIMGTTGKLYGTTYAGGAYGLGTVFELARDGTETVLYNFCSQQNCSDGGFPYAGLITDGSGNLYGTTSEGGTYNSGTVFKVGK